MIADSKQFNQVMLNMADGVDIDLYADVDQEFNQEINSGQVDLYDDVITAPAESSQPPPQQWTNNSDVSSSPLGVPFPSAGGRRYSMYIGNLTWWTTDQDIISAASQVGVHDVLEIKFHENRANGQSKGFAAVHVENENSYHVILGELGKREIHGQLPVVTPCNRQALNQFENASRKAHGGGAGDQPERLNPATPDQRPLAPPPQQAPPPRFQSPPSQQGPPQTFRGPPPQQGPPRPQGPPGPQQGPPGPQQGMPLTQHGPPQPQQRFPPPQQPHPSQPGMPQLQGGLPPPREDYLQGHLLQNAHAGPSCVKRATLGPLGPPGPPRPMVGNRMPPPPRPQNFQDPRMRGMPPLGDRGPRPGLRGPPPPHQGQMPPRIRGPPPPGIRGPPPPQRPDWERPPVSFGGHPPSQGPPNQGGPHPGPRPGPPPPGFRPPLQSGPPGQGPPNFQGPPRHGGLPPPPGQGPPPPGQGPPQIVHRPPPGHGPPPQGHGPPPPGHGPPAHGGVPPPGHGPHHLSSKDFPEAHHLECMAHLKDNSQWHRHQGLFLPQPGSPPPHYGVSIPTQVQVQASQPTPHVNPAFVQANHGQPPPQQMQQQQQPPPADRGPPASKSYNGDQYRQSAERTREPSPPQLSATEFDSLMTRNRTLCSDAISKAVSDASSGEFASAIETLVTAISIIKQSKIAGDDRCKVVISSLQDCLHGIESKSYGASTGGGSSSRGSSRKERESRERDETRHRSRTDTTRSSSSRSTHKRSRSRDRPEYRERSRERGEYRERDRERGREREREYRHR
ncbi:putative cleavage and polyadenylation specificity factor subunit 6-like [Apostichopus japonicus]|uniref:Putative cleavage and polyadenylation specificity factor subunit 6-like n=1 Tax=Stichopus japonicus TaxID=307972 RepID=A0A2G8LDH3_STIJA|nr:putative cleavage and polyadenylation specificity factor subunit 6-like [Apostichopus japonicus]